MATITGVSHSARVTVHQRCVLCFAPGLLPLVPAAEDQAAAATTRAAAGDSSQPRTAVPVVTPASVLGLAVRPDCALPPRPQDRGTLLPSPRAPAVPDCAHARSRRWQLRLDASDSGSPQIVGQHLHAPVPPEPESRQEPRLPPTLWHPVPLTTAY